MVFPRTLSYHISMKIVIIGHSGAGKSYLAKALSKHYGIPCLHMDSVKFYGDFKERPPQEQELIADDFLNTHDNWVCDGNYYYIASRRFLECDTIYYLDLPRLFCLKEALKRYFKNRGKYRDSLGAKEHFDLSFAMWILYGGRKRSYIKEHIAHFKMCHGQRFHFRSRKEIDDHLSSL